MALLEPHPDRLLPIDGSVRSVARGSYAAVARLPTVSTHGQVDPAVPVADTPFRDPASLLVTPDRCVTRAIHRRIDAGYPAELVAAHVLDLDKAVETAVEVTDRLPRTGYRR